MTFNYLFYLLTEIKCSIIFLFPYFVSKLQWESTKAIQSVAIFVFPAMQFLNAALVVRFRRTRTGAVPSYVSMERLTIENITEMETQFSTFADCSVA